MIEELTIKSIHGRGCCYWVEYIENKREYLTRITTKAISPHLNGCKLTVPEAMEIILTHLKSEITIISLN